MLLAAALLSMLCAALPAFVFLRNLRLYAPPPDVSEDRASGETPCVSILIPARNEARGIATCVLAAQASVGVDHEVVVLDDDSTDDTAAIVREIARNHDRVRLQFAPPLPPGWCGKQHACALLAKRARFEILVFIDADVRLQPDGVRRAVEFLRHSRADLASGVPHQETGTFAERLLIPLIPFILLAYLPLDRMRRSTGPAYGAGCGQLFVTTKAAYEAAGGHAAIRNSLHDGIKLPRAYRRAGLRTDLFDATGIAHCRMYRSGAEVWRGLEKNAVEALASPWMILGATSLLLLGHVAPAVILPVAIASVSPPATALSGLAVFLSIAPRLAAIRRFRQPTPTAFLHPLSVLVLLLIQWTAFVRWLLGSSCSWRGRSYGRVKATSTRDEARQLSSPHRTSSPRS